jgi:hypothetical protein
VAHDVEIARRPGATVEREQEKGARHPSLLTLIPGRRNRESLEVPSRPKSL